MPETISDESEQAIFRKKLLKLRKISGRGTELISQYVPASADRSSVMSALSEELSQSSNIKSPQTRKNVQAALRKITNFLKQIEFKIPKTGLAIFAGNISETEGRTDLRLFSIRPPSELNVKLYRCDSQFFLGPLEEMMQPTEIYGLITIDKGEGTIARLSGKRYEILGHFISEVIGKFRAGGQSSKRFEHLREESAQEFYKKMSEKTNHCFLGAEEKLKGIIVGGPGLTKTYFLQKELIDHRLRKKILGTIDTSYTDESGIRELIQKSEELLRETDLMKERKILNEFLSRVAKDQLAAYGQKEVMEALKVGKVQLLLLSEDLDWQVSKFTCPTDHAEETFIQSSEHENLPTINCPACGKPMELSEELDYLDYMLEVTQQSRADIKIISTDSPEGEQFLKSFGGIGAFLRYR
ncbi:MAG: peptide chain release factor 1 [Candidatus Diapherotrites archaeon]|nr:peptide chain release factor 1 [Candidatus Diapherotrites archaeon]